MTELTIKDKETKHLMPIGRTIVIDVVEDITIETLLIDTDNSNIVKVGWGRTECMVGAPVFATYVFNHKHDGWKHLFEKRYKAEDGNMSGTYEKRQSEAEAGHKAIKTIVEAGPLVFEALQKLGCR